MRKRYVCLLLVLLMVLPVIFAACSRETQLVDTPASVYTLCCITGDTTTKEAITAVEYEINRTLFYRIGSIVKLELFTAAEYEQALQNKIDSVTNYLAGIEAIDESSSEEDDQISEDIESLEEISGTASAEVSGTDSKTGKKTLVNTAKLSDSAKENGYTAMSGEAILDDLANGIEIELECPRIDMFLVTDYQTYLEMAKNEELTALDTTLSNEAKAIKSYVHSSFFNAAKVGNKTYGIPCNTSIGEYTYVVFDKDVLKESGVAQETLYSLDDLSEFLAIVKQNNPDVVPLANTINPSDFSYMFEEGFASYVNKSGFVRSTYDDNAINKYFTMIARYKALGYFENAAGQTGSDANAKVAVKFMTGSVEEMEDYAEKNGYVFNQFSVPIATSENSIDCIYCISSLCPSSWVTDVMEILTELYTDVNLQNTYLYGIQNENYRIEDGQVIHINQNYIMNPSNTGNCFIAYTDKDAGDSVNKWTNARNQNIDAVESKTIGFTFTPNDYVFGTTIDEEGNEVEIKVTEPEYTEIMWEVIQPYYEKLINGDAIEFDYQAEYDAAEATALEEIQTNLLATYTKRLELSYTENIEETAKEKYEEQFQKIAEEKIREDVKNMFTRSSYRKSLLKNIKADLSEAHEDWDDDKIEEEAEKLAANDDYVYDNYRTIVKKQSLLDNAKESYYKEALEEKVTEMRDAILSSKEYVNALNAIPTSEKFVDELNYSIEVYVADTVNTNLENAISGLISEFNKGMMAECEAKLTEAIDLFVEQYVEESNNAYDRAIYEAVKEEFGSAYLAELAESGKSGEDLEKAYESKLQQRAAVQKDFNAANAEVTVIKLESALKKQIAADYGELNEEELSQHLSAAEKKFDEVYLPLYSDYFNAKALALYKIGFTDRSPIKNFIPEEEPTETEEPVEPVDPVDPDADEPTPDADGHLYNTYYDFVIAVKIRTPYYLQFGTPQ